MSNFRRLPLGSALLALWLSPVCGFADSRPDTVIIHTSDRGFYLGDHNWYDKRFTFKLKTDSCELKQVYADPRQAEALKQLKASPARLRTELHDEDQLQDLKS